MRKGSIPKYDQTPQQNEADTNHFLPEQVWRLFTNGVLPRRLHCSNWIGFLERGRPARTWVCGRLVRLSSLLYLHGLIRTPGGRDARAPRNFAIVLGVLQDGLDFFGDFEDNYTM